MRVGERVHRRRRLRHETKRWRSGGTGRAGRSRPPPTPRRRQLPGCRARGELSGVSSCHRRGACTAVSGGGRRGVGLGAPSVSIRAPASGARYALGEVVVAHYSCRKRRGRSRDRFVRRDAVPNGSRIDTTKPGAAHVHRDRDQQGRAARIADGELHDPAQQPVHGLARPQLADGTFTFSVRIPAPGDVDVLETAWNDNLASAAVLLKPAPRQVRVRPPTRTRGAAWHGERDGHTQPARESGSSLIPATGSCSGCGSATPQTEGAIAPSASSGYTSPAPAQSTTP